MRIKKQTTSVILSAAKDPVRDSSPDRPSGAGELSGRPPLEQPAAFGLRMTVFLNAIMFSLFFSVYTYAQDLAPIQIQKVEGGRTEAVVPGSVVPKEKPTDFAGQGFYYFETGILKTARFASSYVGKVTDGAVWGIQKISEPIFAPIIKALDVRQWANKKQASRDRI